MKKFFSLMVLALVATITVDASAQTIVGKWNSSAGAQANMLASIGGQVNEQTAIMTYNSDNTYSIYSYVDATADVMGYEMHMVMESSETGTWSLDGSRLTLTSNKFDLSKFDITFSDPSLNAAGEQVKSIMSEAFSSSEGMTIMYNIEFVDNNTAKLIYDNDIMPMDYTITRIE